MPKFHGLTAAGRSRPCTCELHRFTHLTSRIALRQASDSNPKDYEGTPSEPTTSLPRTKSQASRIASQQIQDLRSPSKLTRQMPRAPGEEHKVKEVVRRTQVSGAPPNTRVSSGPRTSNSIGNRKGQLPIRKNAAFGPKEQIGEVPATRGFGKGDEMGEQGNERDFARQRGFSRRKQDEHKEVQQEKRETKKSKEEYVDDLNDPDTMTPAEYLQEHHEDAFHSEQDAHLYGALMSKIAKIRSEIEEVEGSKRQQGGSAVAERRSEEIDNKVRGALQDLQTTKDTIYPPHEPQTHSLEHFKASVGEAPIGSAGMGAVVEDNLRHLAGQGWGWRDPKKLAKRLIDGEFVKFDSFTEKKEVINLVRSMAATPGADEDLKNVRFRPLREEARRSVVERLAAGKAEEPSGQRSPILEAVSNLTHGHVPASARNTMLETVQDLMPKPKPNPSS